MKIAIVCYPTFGGSGVVATELGHQLCQRGHEVHFVCYNQPARLNLASACSIHFHLVDVVSYPLFQFPPYTLALATKLFKVAQEVNLDLIHTHYAVPHATAAYLAKQMLGRNIPTLTTLHGTDIELVGLDDSYRDIVRWSLEQSDGITAVSQFLKDRTLTEFKLTRDIEVIPNFVDTALFQRRENPSLRERLAPAGEKLLIHASNFREVKNIPDIVEVFSRLHHRIPARMVFIGEGPYRQVAESLVKEKGLQEDVIFIDFVKDISPYMGIADCLLVASKTESFGLTALEAMSCSVPVVAYRVGGLPEVVEEGVSGHLVPLGDIDGLVNAAEYILSDTGHQLMLGEGGRRRAVSQFQAEPVTIQYEKLYERLVRLTRARP